MADAVFKWVGANSSEEYTKTQAKAASAPVFAKSAAPVEEQKKKKQFSNWQEERAYVNTLGETEARSHFGEEWGNVDYDEAKQRGMLDTYGRRINPFNKDANFEGQSRIGGAVEDFTPVGGLVTQRRFYNEKEAEHQKFVKEHPEFGTQLQGDGALHTWVKGLGKRALEGGLDLMEVVPAQFDYKTTKSITNGIRKNMGMKEEAVFGSRAEAAQDFIMGTGKQLQEIGNSFVDGTRKMWTIAKEPDALKKKEMMAQFTQETLDSMVSAVTLGVGGEIQRATSFTTDNENVYLKGEKIGDLTPARKEAAGAGRMVGGLAGSLVAWRMLSPWIGKKLTTAFPAVKGFAVAHPYVFQITAANAAEEAFQAAVSGVAGVPYTFADTIVGLGMQFGFESFRAGKAGIQSRMEGVPMSTKYDPLGFATEMQRIDQQAALKVVDDTVAAYVDGHGRVPSAIELQELIGGTPVPVLRGDPLNFNELHYLTSKNMGNFVRENRLIGLDGGKEGRPGIERSAPLPEGKPDMDALIKKYGSEDNIPLHELDRAEYDRVQSLEPLKVRESGVPEGKMVKVPIEGGKAEATTIDGWLYRAVSKEEFAEIQRTGKITPSKPEAEGMAGRKYFDADPTAADTFGSVQRGGGNQVMIRVRADDLGELKRDPHPAGNDRTITSVFTEGEIDARKAQVVEGFRDRSKATKEFAVKPAIEDAAPKTGAEQNHLTRLQEMSPSDRRYIRDNADSVVLTEKSVAGIKKLQRLAQYGLVEMKEDGTAVVLPEARSFAAMAKQDLPPSFAGSRAYNEQQIYGGSIIRSEYEGKPVTTNAYVLEFDKVKDEPFFGKVRKSNMPESALRTVVDPAKGANVKVEEYAFRDEGNDPRSSTASQIFLKAKGGEFTSVDAGYLNYFKKKYGKDVQFFMQKDAKSMSPVSVKSPDGKFLGVIMPMRIDPDSLPPAPVRFDTKTEKVGKSKIDAAKREGTVEKPKTDQAVPQPVVKTDAPSGDSKPPSVAIEEGFQPRKQSKLKITKEPPRAFETPARSSRLQDRLATPSDSKVEAPTREAVKAFIEKELTAPLRTGSVPAQAGAVFKPLTNTVRMREGRFLNIDDASHEIGHYLDHELGVVSSLKQTNGKVSNYSEPHRSELLTLADDPDGMSSAKSKSAPLARKMSEGFAEFIRKYVTQPRQVKAIAPNFYKHFEAQVPKEGLRLLQEARKAYADIQAQDPEFRVKSHISSDVKKAPITDRISKAVDTVFEVIDDELLALRKFTRKAEATLGKELPYKDDPYIRARLTRGMDAKVLQFVGTNLKPFKANGEFRTDVRSLGDILRDAGDRADFDAYLASKRAIDLHKQKITTGFADSDVKHVVEAMEARHPEFAKLQREIVGWNRALLEYARDSGFLSDKQLADMTKNGDNYVPFNRVIDDEITQGKGGKKFADVSNPFKKIKGSERTIISPIESMTRNAYVVISAVDRNRVGQTLVKVASMHPDLGALIEEIPAGKQAIRISAENLVKQLGLEPEVAGRLEEVVTLFAAGNKPGAAGENVMMVVKDGKPHFYAVDPFLYRAVTSMNTEQAGILWRMFAKPASLLRAGATLTPEFMGRNPIRDQASAFIYSRANYIPLVDFGRGVVDVIGKSDEYQRLAVAGAMQSSFVSLDRPSLKANVDRMIQTRGETAVHYLTHPIDALRATSEFGELGTRVGEGRKVFAKEMKANGGDYEEALMRSGFSARNVTLDFSRRGSAGKLWNMVTAFWNANKEDMTKFGREFTGREKGSNPMRAVIKAGIGLTLPSVGFYALSKNDPRYEELPRWQKDYFWIAAVPGYPIVRVPKPFLPGLIFGSLPVRLMEAAEKKSTRPIKDFFTSLHEISIPGLMPTAMLPIVEWTTGYSFFFSRSTVPQSEQSLLPEDQYGIYTPEMYKAIGKMTGQSPRKIETLVYGYTAGLGRYATNFIDFVGAKTGVLPERPELPTDISDLPVVKAFVISDMKSQTQSITDFYDRYAESMAAYQSLGKASDSGDTKRMQELGVDHLPSLIFIKPDGEPDFLFHALAPSVELMSQLRKAEEAVIKSKLSPEAKRAKLLEIDRMQRDIAKAALRATENRPSSVDELKK